LMIAWRDLLLKASQLCSYKEEQMDFTVAYWGYGAGKQAPCSHPGCGWWWGKHGSHHWVKHSELISKVICLLWAWEVDSEEIRDFTTMSGEMRVNLDLRHCKKKKKVLPEFWAHDIPWMVFVRSPSANFNVNPESIPIPLGSWHTLRSHI
jgi:hypothetical protein